MLQMYYESQWSGDSTVLNTAVVIYLKLSNVYDNIVIDVDCFVEYWLLAAFD